MRIGCVVMAAGNGSRFGSNKLLRVIDGKSVIERALDAVPRDVVDTVAVVTQYAPIMELAKRRGFSSVENRYPERGISYTIKLGLQTVQQTDAVLFMVADQPLLQRETVERLVEFYLQQPQRIAALAHNGVRGNPCIFPAACFPALLALQGDTGGGAVIKADAHGARLLETDEKQLCDIDTPQELEKLVK